MNICVITSTFPTNEADPIGGFILDFCLKLSEYHKVSVITQKRSDEYKINRKINLVTFDWTGNRIPLADLKFYKPNHLYHFFSLTINARKTIKSFLRSSNIDYTFALWAIPSGILSYYLFRKNNTPYDVWCLGSDIWKHKDNFLTKSLLIRILTNSKNLYADGFEFCNEIETLSKKQCLFLPSSRVIRKTEVEDGAKGKKRFVFIGRYHYNKGPDILIEAIKNLPQQILEKSEFVFFGTGLLKKQLIESLNKKILPHVYIHDILDNESIYSTLAYAHFLIIPSRFDSIPVILSDSLQCLTPIIGADIGDLGPVIKKYHLGFTFKKEDSIELAEKISEAFYQNKEKYINDIQKALLLFSVDHAVNLFTNNLIDESFSSITECK